MIISSLSSLGFFLSERSIRPEFPRSFFFDDDDDCSPSDQCTKATLPILSICTFIRDVWIVQTGCFFGKLPNGL